MDLKEWHEYDRRRNEVISENRSRRMRVPQQPPIPVPQKLEKPCGYLVDTIGGDYVGFWPIDDIESVRESVQEYHDPADCVFTRTPLLR